MYSKKLAGLFSAVILLAMVLYIALEPSVTKAVNAGPDTATVTATVTGEIDISSPVDTTFSASIPGMTGNPGAPVTASLTWTVKTNNATGFNMTLKADHTSTLQLDASNVFTDASLTPSYNWTAATSGQAAFGFSPQSATAADTVQAFRDNNSSACNSASNYTGHCWSGFNGTTAISIINRSSNTASAGEAEVINFKAESNAKFLKSGTTYSATITATVAMNP
jgi:hypothetical protein